MQLQHPRRTTRSSLPDRRRPTRHDSAPRSRRGHLALPLLITLGSSACGHDWDAYDPRLGSGGTSSSTTGGSAGSATGGGGAGGTTTSVGGATGGTTTSVGGATGGTTMSTGGGTTSTTSSTGTCDPGTTQNCYTGPAGTMDIGLCKHGSQTCNDQGTGYEACVGEVKPLAEECGNAADEDCNALPDDHCGLWAKRFGDNGSQRANDVAVDAQSNVIVVGRAEETTNFGGQDLDAGGSQSAFVVKLTKDGAHVWSHLYGDAQAQEAVAVATDGNSGVYVTGTFSGTIVFDGTTLVSTGGQDVFVVKLDAAGSTVWAKAISGTGTQNARGIAVDALGDTYVTGSFTGTTDFGGSQATAVSQLDGYLVKLDPTGALAWTKTFGGDGDDEGMAVAARSGDIAFTGYFSDTITLGGNNLNGGSGVDAFVASVTVAGSYNFAKAYVANGDQYPRAIGLSSGGSAFVLGDFTQSAKFGATTLTSAGGNDVFLARIDNEGDSQWAFGYGDGASQDAAALSVDSSGDLALAIHHRGSFDYGGGTLSQAGSPPAGDMVVVKVSGSTGDHLWSRRFGDSLDQDPRGIAHDGTKNVYVVGALSGSANFGPGALTSGGQDDVLVAKLAP